MAPLRSLTLFALAGLLLPSPISAGAVDGCSTGPRTLVLALDGVPFRTVERARELGAFPGWPEPTPLVSTFPSMTNVAFTAMLQPFGLERIVGYEIRHYDYELNRVVGGGAFGYTKRAFAWREFFQVAGRTTGSKVSMYMTPKGKSWAEIAKVEKLVMDSHLEVMFAHVGSTDMLIHFRGDDPVVGFLAELSARLDSLERRHQETRHRSLRVVLLSDHGNSDAKVRTPGGIRQRLQEAGLRPSRRLERSNDVVAATFGVVNYGALYLAPQHAANAAQAVVGHEAVSLAAWVSSENEVRVVSSDGEAVIRWRDAEGGWRYFSYDPQQGDPLRLLEVRAQLLAADFADAAGFASEQEWFALSALSEYPDALRRLVDSLTETTVSPAATVIFSLEVGYAWGLQIAQAGAHMMGGNLEGTHGGLDRDSTLGFFIANDPRLKPSVAIRAEDALSHWDDLRLCLGQAGVERSEQAGARVP